jgi:hypothetical protein
MRPHFYASLRLGRYSSRTMSVQPPEVQETPNRYTKVWLTSSRTRLPQFLRRNVRCSTSSTNPGTIFLPIVKYTRSLCSRLGWLSRTSSIRQVPNCLDFRCATPSETTLYVPLHLTRAKMDDMRARTYVVPPLPIQVIHSQQFQPGSTLLVRPLSTGFALSNPVRDRTFACPEKSRERRGRPHC